MLGKERVEQLFYKHCKRYSSLTIIPFSEISDEPVRYFKWYAFEIEMVLNCTTVADPFNHFIYIYKEIDDNMSCKYTIEIPYSKHDDHVETVYEINSLVDENGCVCMFVDNNPYHLKAYLCVECEFEEKDKIEQILKRTELKTDNQFGLGELLSETQYRGYNTHTLLANMSKEDITNVFRRLFIFASEEELMQKGYSDKRHFFRPKIFISYCHKNKSIVYKIIDDLKSAGLDFWLDETSIDVGDNILSSIMNGIEQSDFAILFLSKATAESNYSQMELNNIMAKMINKKMGWYVVKLDDVDIEQILPCLSNYKYFDMTTKSEEDLELDIISQVEKLSTQKGI